MEEQFKVDFYDLATRLMDVERELEDSRLQFQRIADALPYGIWTCGPDGELLHISDSFLNLVGMTLEECQQFGWWGKLPPDEIEATRAHWKHCLLNAKSYNREHSMLGRDGVRHAVLVRAVPIKDDLGRVTSWVGIHLDIDDRKRDESALRESEHRFVAMADEAPVLIWMSGPDGIDTYYNLRWRELTGIPFEERLGDAWKDCVHPDDSESRSAHYADAFERRQAFEHSVRILDRNKKYRTLLNRGIPRFRDDGAFAGYVGCCTDISDIVEARAKSVRADERYRMVCQSIHALVYDFDTLNQTIEYSSGMDGLLGIEAEPKGSPIDWWLGLVHADDRERLNKAVFNSDGEVYEVEYRVRDAAGTYIPVMDRGVRRVDAAGTVTRIIGCITAIPETRSALQGNSARELLQTIVEISPWPSFLLDSQATPVQANAETLSILGIEALVRLDDFVDLIHPEDRAEAAGELEAAVKERRQATLEFRAVRNDGDREIQLELFPIRDNAQVLVGFVGLLADISRRKRSQRKLEQSEALYRALAESSANLVFTRLPNGGYDYVNRRWCEYTGLSFEESKGDGWRKAFHPDDLPSINLSAEEAYELEQRVWRHDGQYRWFLFQRTPVLDSQGAVIKWLGTGTDIHDIKLKETHLREGAEMVRSALSVTGLILYRQDLDLRYTWICRSNDPDVPDEMLLGKTDSEILGVEAANALVDLKRRVIGSRERARETVRLEFGGKVLIYDLLVEPLLDEQDQVIGVTGAAFDLTSLSPSRRRDFTRRIPQ